MLRRLALLFPLLILAACETKLAVPSYADLTFAHRPPIALDVAKITVVEAYQSPYSLPNVEHEFPVPPAQMAANWARDRLNPVGTAGELVFTIREAGVVEVPLEQTEGLSGLMTVEQAERYDAKLIVTMEAFNPTLGTSANSRSSIERSRTMAEDVTLNEREAIWYDMTEAMGSDLDQQLETALDKYFTKFRR